MGPGGSRLNAASSFVHVSPQDRPTRKDIFPLPLASLGKQEHCVWVCVCVGVWCWLPSLGSIAALLCSFLFCRGPGVQQLHFSDSPASCLPGKPCQQEAPVGNRKRSLSLCVALEAAAAAGDNGFQQRHCGQSSDRVPETTAAAPVQVADS